ncbi:hypothetical protein ABC795_09665 [Blastococcus sp. HT6-30]|uniref:hypothetical protein n=1 Tax=Blastococcus sp. HT6-30 TaxID=3144843 RepID=UPI003219B272
MCGGCRGAAGPAPPEDLLAGAGPAQRAARAAAAGRLLAGRRMRVSAWRGGYLLTAATGRAHVAASLEELWNAAGLPRAAPHRPAAGEWAEAAPPAGWDVQAGVVWLSAALRSGEVTEAALPAGPAGRIAVRGPEPGRALAGLLAFGSGDGPASPGTRSSAAPDASGRNAA